MAVTTATVTATETETETETAMATTMTIKQPKKSNVSALLDWKFHIKKMHCHVAVIEIDCMTYDDRTHL